MLGGLKGPLSPPQELEVGGCRPPYLLVVHICINLLLVTGQSTCTYSWLSLHCSIACWSPKILTCPGHGHWGLVPSIQSSWLTLESPRGLAAAWQRSLLLSQPQFCCQFSSTNKAHWTLARSCWPSARSWRMSSRGICSCEPGPSWRNSLNS